MTSLPSKNPESAQQIPDSDKGPLIEIGQWYWAKENEESKKLDWFSCVVHIGSNFVKLQDPGGSYTRIHINDFEKETKLELDPEKIIKDRMGHYQGVVQHNLSKIREITSRLGVDPRQNSQAPKSESRELSTFNAMPDLKKYKKALIRAKEKELPALFKKVEKAHEDLTTWMLARTVPMKARTDGLQDCIENINDRVFNISLYAGLSEEVTKISDGEPAPISEKLHLFQRMHFMDEECLVNYRHGGMEFGNLDAFDEWLAAPAQRDRILPFPRSMVAFRVRRNTKDRYYDGSLSCAMINIRCEQQDKYTFMYIRNGEKVFRMDCAMEFDEHIFPSSHQVDLSEPMMAKKRIDDVGDVITKRHWESLVREYVEEVRLHDEWERDHKNDKDKNAGNPHWVSGFDDPRREYEPFNKSSVYFDDMEEQVAKQVKYYNRIALILQGLFDRSDVLHPHPPARLWEAGGMEALVELMYDGAGAIHFGKPPDFEAYRTKVNASIDEGSFAIGQEKAWKIREAKIENGRWNSRRTKNVQEYEPYGDPGPGYVAQVKDWQPRARNAVFRWSRESRSYSRYNRNPAISCALRVQADKLFNVSGYRPGDYMQFFQDPRTRAEYLKWAPLLLAAEEWHAGNLDRDGSLKKKGKGKKA